MSTQNSISSENILSTVKMKYFQTNKDREKLLPADLLYMKC